MWSGKFCSSLLDSNTNLLLNCLYSFQCVYVCVFVMFFFFVVVFVFCFINFCFLNVFLHLILSDYICFLLHRMLDKFVQDQRNKPNQTSINVTYVVSGEQDTESGVKVRCNFIPRRELPPSLN